MSVYVTTVKKLPLQVRWMSQDSVENSQLARLYTSVKVDAFVEQRRLSRIVTHLTAMRLFSRIVHSFASRLAVTRLPIDSYLKGTLRSSSSRQLDFGQYLLM